MAISYITGVPRSGKSYFSTYMIYQMYKPFPKEEDKSSLTKVKEKLFPLEERKQYSFTYTNINQFNFKFHKSIRALDWELLYAQLSELHNMAVINKADDEALKERTKTLELFDALFVVDECHNFFTKKEDPIIVWWLTYHGHMHQEIHFITQQMELVPEKYKGIAEFFYKVYHASKSLYAKRFLIGQYSSFKYFKNSKVKDFSIPFDPKVYEMYVSGKAQKRTLVMTKYIIYIIIMLLITSLTVYNLFSGFESQMEENRADKPKQTDISQSSTQVNQHKQTQEIVNLPQTFQNIDYTQMRILRIECIASQCKYADVTFPVSFLLHYVTHNDVPFYDVIKVGNSITIYTLLAKESFAEFLLKNSPVTQNNSKKGGRSEKVPALNLFGN